MKLITTSWDDGYPADDRIGELLDKYNLRGTFYIPRTNDEHEVMSENAIASLSKNFEIGGHTLHHVRIKAVSKSLFANEIKGSYLWLQDLLGGAPVSFCFPGGVINRPAVEYTLKTGYKIIRTTELLSTKIQAPDFVIPTTLQVYNHSTITYYKHLIKRGKIGSMRIYMQGRSTSNLLKLVEYYVDHVLKNDGCFHLWGHSWELEEYGLWNELEEILKLISNVSELRAVTNGQLLKYNDE